MVQSDDGFQIQSLADTREEFAPEINGFQIWQKDLQCDYCQQPFSEAGSLMILKWPAPAIYLQCIPCFEAMCAKMRRSSSYGRSPVSIPRP